ncbi:DUF418 domain-containing protein [Thermasporomyces composti]|jgi:uncharacterized membrane protein YeiB|uniref:Putative membrane protein YeiB n=1 Tax=Thermasporomyces composti TaxID=696763 RepID=A0A3D9VCD2_THECX|nr:DUF418 domain-containing protein [Thermasporomyces composti]REF36725.1 putative membrane protein YeiB [Thermasporomyces composti]
MVTESRPFVASTARGPTNQKERALAPDLARGAMLLLIALANGTGVFFASTPGVEPTPRGLERLVTIAQLELVNARAIPLFAFLFGYSLVQFTRRQEAAGSSPAAVRAVLLRRSCALLAFGAVHGILLYAGDILGTYGLIGLIFGLVLLHRGDRVHRAALWLLGLLGVYVVALSVVVAVGLIEGAGPRAAVPTTPFPSVAADSYVASVHLRWTEWPTNVMLLLAYFPIVWVGVWAARRRVLEEPARHHRLLHHGAVVGWSAGILGGLPMALLAGGLLAVDTSTAPWAKLLHEVSGIFGGLGYVCLFGLVVARLTSTSRRRSRFLTALTALGQRSLTGYLCQSVAWLVLASPYTLALGTRTGSTTFVAVGSAIAVWLVTLVGADLMRRRGYRGPAELVLRRLAYGRSRARADGR